MVPYRRRYIVAREDLEKEAEEWVVDNTEIFDDEEFGLEYEEQPQAKEAYLAGAEPREKRIEELEQQIKEMKCDVKQGQSYWNTCDMQYDLYQRLLDKWEIKV